MATPVSSKYLEKVEIHFRDNIPLQHLNMTEEGKKRLLICKEIYMRFVDNPAINTRQHIHSKYPDRSISEISNDIQVLNHILGFMNQSVRNIEKFKVNYMSDKMMRIGDSQGDCDALAKAATIKIKIHQLDQSDSEADEYENVAAMPIAITSDVSVVKPDQANISDERKKELFEKYGAKPAEIIELLETSQGEYEFAHKDEKSEPDMYVENEKLISGK